MGDTQTQDRNDAKAATAEDLDLIDDGLEDEGKDDEELWKDIDEQETAAANGEDTTDDESGASAGAAGSVEGQLTADIDAGKTGGASSDQDDKGDQGEGGEADNLWDGADASQREAFDAAQATIKKLEQSERSNRGRVSTLQRQLNDITNQLQRSASTATPDGDSDGDADGAETTGYLDSKDWKDFEEEYAEVAGPLGKVVTGMQTEIDRQKKQLDAIGIDRLQDAVNEQTELLEQDHPDWQDAATDPLFGDWLEDQPRHMREAAVRNAAEIVDASEAADVIGRFKAFRLEQGDSPAGPGKPDDDSDDQETVTSLSGKRKRQLESSSGSRPRGAGAATGIPADGDEKELWDAFDKQEAREARQA